MTKSCQYRKHLFLSNKIWHQIIYLKISLKKLFTFLKVEITEKSMLNLSIGAE